METHQTFSWKRLSILGVLTFLFYLWMSWALPMTDTVESNYALSAFTMVHHGEYMSPMIYDKYWFDKPIVTYWGLVLSYTLFGVSDFAARLPSIAVSTLTVMAMYRMVFELFKKERIALWSAIALGTSLEFWYIGHAVLTDGYLLLFSLGIFYFLFKGITEESHRYMVYAYGCAALGMLTKGPVAIVLPGIIVLIYTILIRKWEWMKYIFSWKGIVTWILLSLPWYGYMYAIHGMDFIQGFLGFHNVTRATIPEHPDQNWWYLYFVLLPISVLPWTSFTVRGILEEKHSYLWYWSIFWLIGVILFYTLMATKYITYTYIGLIPLAIWTGLGIDAFLRTYEVNVVPFKKVLSFMSGPAFFLILIPIALFMTLDGDMTWLIVSFIITIISFGIVLIRRTAKAFIQSMLASTVLFYLALVMTIVPIVEDQSGRDLVPVIHSLEENHPMDVYQYGTYRTSLTYYLDRPTTYIHYKDVVDVWEQGKNLMPMTSEKELLEENPNLDKVLIFVPFKYEPHFKKLKLYHMMKPVASTKKGNFYMKQ